SFMILALLLSLASVGCGNWAEFGNSPLNPHRSYSEGPAIGITTQANLIPGGIGATFGSEVGVLVDFQGDYYVSSYDPEIQVYDHAGNWAGAYNLGVTGPRAAPYVASRAWGRTATIFTGAVGGGGGFHAIRVDKTVFPYTLTLMDSDAATGPSESSPKRAKDGTFYICDFKGTVHRYSYSGGTLTHLASLALDHEVRGAIALYDADPQFRREEVLVATTDGRFYVLDHKLSTIIWSDTSGVGPLGSDNYYAGVTVAERGPLGAPAPGAGPVALLPIAGNAAGTFAANSGKVRAINLQLHAVDWELTPSMTTPGHDAIEGSVAVLFEQPTPGTPGNPGDGTGQDDGIVDGGFDDGDIIVGDGSGLTGIVPMDYHATFASTDRFLYGVDIVSGTEVWAYEMKTSGFDAPVVDAVNVIYVGDGRSVLHAVEGSSACGGCPIWMDTSLAIGGATDIVKLGVTNKRALVVGTGKRAFALFQ
ncbi:MAG: hypothetical protein NZ990_17290, partial [Myxococcota bacterium]|nr:hypothetical protein [Myxococcota bacterium]